MTETQPEVGSGARLVSFLGLGPLNGQPPYYTPARYAWDGDPSAPTPLIARAICDHFAVGEVIVLGTRQVEQRWIETGLFAELLGRAVDFRGISAGRTSEENWDLFRETVRALSEGVPPETILFDVTHGFRIQPLLGCAALAFAQSEWRRTGAPAPTVRVLYGAFDAPTAEGHRPIWDLTAFLTAARYDAAIDALIRYGRGDDLAELAERDTRSAVGQARADGAQGAALGPHAHLQRVGTAARSLADDLALGRAHRVFTQSAPSLGRLLNESATRSWIGRLPVLEGAVSSLGESVAQLQAAGSIGSEGAIAMGQLARQYERTQRYAEQAATLREGLVTFAATQLDRTLLEPGTRGCKGARAAVEGQLGELTNRFKSDRAGLEQEVSRELYECVRLAASVQQVRNDIEHLGMNDKPARSGSLRTQLGEYTNAYAALVGAGTDGARQASSTEATGCFVNLSNHPIETWPEGQRAAVRAMGFDAPQELEGAMPLADVEADETAILALARDIAERAQRQAARAAFVASDFTLAYALVGELAARGVRSYAAVTHRESVERQLPDGSIKREIRYQFLRFREYVSA